MKKEPELEIVYLTEADALARSTEDIIRYVKTLTPHSTLPLQQWQQLARVYRLIGERFEHRIHCIE